MTERPWCAHCDYSEPNVEDDGTLFCRRYAPRPIPGEESQPVRWPLVGLSDWCGEHLPAGTLQESEDPLGSFTRG